MLKGGSAQKVSFAKLRRVVAFQGVIGPELPLTTTSGCCGAARHCGHSCILQHFCWLKRRCADIAAI